LERRLATILAIDVVGYTRLMGQNEEATLANLHKSRDLIDRLVAAHDGRTFGVAGDSVIAEFSSPVKGVQCAIEIQSGMADLNADIAQDSKMQLRIGVNLGDAVVDGDSLFGEGVNIAARLEQLAPPGGIVLSRAVRDQIRDRLDITLADLGQVTVKNVARPLRAFQLLRDGEAPIALPKPVKPRGKFVGVTLVLALLVIAGSLWQMNRTTSIPADPANFALAVLAFENLSNDPEQTYFSDGFAADLISDLSSLQGLTVISRTSSFAYRGRDLDVRKIGKDLGVTHVLEGSVRRVDDTVRITARLVNAANRSQEWAGRYERKLINVFDVQDEIRNQIVSALDIQLASGEQSRALAAHYRQYRNL
jgi:adenylate cyclase